MLRDGAPVNCEVAGDVLRLTVACSRSVGSKGRYCVSIKYSDETRRQPVHADVEIVLEHES